jgi:hypothetical protein
MEEANWTLGRLSLDQRQLLIDLLEQATS